MAGGLRFDSISVGSAHACGLTSAGAAYCWGANIYGELGDNTLVNHHVPGAVSGGGIWGSISASYFFTCALSATATASCWGINETFQLGNGTQTQRLIPTALPAPSLAQIVTLDHSACGLTAAGAVYCWGSGFGTTPTPIPGSVVP
jgi:alpha-tubulin suppressor-like RCC1 family protein